MEHNHIKGGVYKITSPTGKIYIGKSIDIKTRWSSYQRLSCEDQPLLYNSFKKYGVENHKFEVVFESEDDDVLKEKEMELILSHRSNLNRFRKDNVGLNLTDGGDGSNGFKHSEEAKAKISNIQKGKKLTYEHIESVKEQTSKMIINLNTGIYYRGCTEASESVGEHRSSFQKRLVGKRPNKYNMWYADDVANNRVADIIEKYEATFKKGWTEERREAIRESNRRRAKHLK